MNKLIQPHPTGGNWGNFLHWKGLTPRQRFDSHWIPEPNTGCWLWMKHLTPSGYGVFSVASSTNTGAHRAAWEFYRGPIPEGLVIDHICRVRSCVNPDHLRVVTRRINTLENSLSITALFAKKTHCKNGHPLIDGHFSGGNHTGLRHLNQCKRCIRERDDRRLASKGGKRRVFKNPRKNSWE